MVGPMEGEVKTPFSATFAITTGAFTAVEGIGEGPRLKLLLGLRELVLRRVFKVARWWFWKVWVVSRETLVAELASVRGIAKEPGAIVWLLHRAGEIQWKSEIGRAHV